MDLSFNLAQNYGYLKDPTSRQNFEDTPGEIPKLILTLRLRVIVRQQTPEVVSFYEATKVFRNQASSLC